MGTGQLCPVRRQTAIKVVKTGWTRPILAFGRQAIVLNVFTERAWRRHGLARHLMDHVLAWARVAGVDTLVLHASDEGRTLYEELGFIATNEMRYAGDLC